MHSVLGVSGGTGQLTQTRVKTQIIVIVRFLSDILSSCASFSVK